MKKIWTCSCINNTDLTWLCPAAKNVMLSMKHSWAWSIDLSTFWHGEFELWIYISCEISQNWDIFWLVSIQNEDFTMFATINFIWIIRGYLLPNRKVFANPNINRLNSSKTLLQNTRFRNCFIIGLSSYWDVLY